MGARKKLNMDIEITKITDKIKGSVSPSELAHIRSGLHLLKVAQEALIDGQAVYKEDMSAIGAEVGARLKAARLKKGLSQEELEVRSKIPQSTISKIEKGHRMITPHEATALAKIFSVTPQFLIAGD